MHLFLSVGEPSGDQHAAHLIHALRQQVPDAEFSGFGGPLMEQAGFSNLYRLTDLAVMGVGGVVPVIQTFYRQYRRARKFLRRRRPQAVVLVDCPGFNWWIAKAAKQLGIPVLYYMPPQLWAWAGWRIRKIHKWVDLVLASLPFEADWYRDHGANVRYVGHPFFDEVAGHRLDQNFINLCRHGDHGQPVRTVGILPGSRKHEVLNNFPTMLRVMANLSRKHPDVRFKVACYKESQREFCRRLLCDEYARLPVDLHVGRTPEIIETAECCLMTSGSVSLELLARTTPAVVQYRGGPLMYSIASVLVTCNYMSLPNLIANRPLMPEFPFVRRTAEIARAITRPLDEWLSDRQKLDGIRNEMDELRQQIVRTGGIQKAAEVILECVGHQTGLPHRRAA